MAALLLGAVGGFAAALSDETRNWNAGWEFIHGDKGGGAAETRVAEPVAWRRVHLPHDWSIELGIDESAPAAGHGGFFQTGVGWYRKVFHAPAEWRGKQVALLFEGVYRDATIFVNGEKLSRTVHGYTPWEVDLTKHLRTEGENVVTMRVDNSAQPNSRWYTGSGIYRPVWLKVRAPVHVATGGVFVSTASLTPQSAELRIETTLRNLGTTQRSVRVETKILDPRGRSVAEVVAEAELEAGADAVVVEKAAVKSPLAWSPGQPVLYRAVTRVADGRETIDEVETVFGIRTVRVSAERGFELNGVSVELNGGNVHHDNGVLGAAAFARAEERKAELLKRAGYNAVRTAHNPPSRAFLEACDRLGLLVVNEIFDGWAKGKNKHDYSVFFAEWWQRDVEAWVRRDRNHASVVMWSIGNEMFERGGAGGQKIARDLAQRVRELDATRPVTAGVNGMGKSGEWTQLDPLFAALDVAGYNYELAHHKADHARLPQRVIMAAESYQNEIFANWAATQDHPYVIGDFVWTALDYLGEAGIGRVFGPDEKMLKHWEGSLWPWFGAYCGDIDLTGWRKPISHYRNVVWDAGEKLSMAVLPPAPGGRKWNLSPWSFEPALPSWTWPGHVGATMTVEVYSRMEAVRLELNGKSLGEKPTGRAQEFRARFEVPYAPGEIVAIGLERGVARARHVMRSAGEPVRLSHQADRTRLRADGEDLAFITLEAVDKSGGWNSSAATSVTVEVSGTGTLAGFGTADMQGEQPYSARTRKLFQGRALIVVRASTEPGEIQVRVTGAGLKTEIIKLRARAP